MRRLLVLLCALLMVALPRLAGADALAQAGAVLVDAGAAVLVIDAESGAERFVGGPVDRPVPPGSLFKLVTALTAGDLRLSQLAETLRCPAPQRRFPRCGHAHGLILFEQALAQSCNAYFAQLGAAAGGAALLETAWAWGLSRLPSAAAVASEDDAALLAATGEGVRVTPREMAALMRGIALGRRPPGMGTRGESRRAGGLALLPRLRDALRLAAHEGTASGVEVEGDDVAVAGKTGTAVFGAGTVGWFAGFAPAQAPSAVFVVLERSHRGADVAKAARSLVQAYFHGAVH